MSLSIASLEYSYACFSINQLMVLHSERLVVLIVVYDAIHALDVFTHA